MGKKVAGAGPTGGGGHGADARDGAGDRIDELDEESKDSLEKSMPFFYHLMDLDKPANFLGLALFRVF